MIYNAYHLKGKILVAVSLCRITAMECSVKSISR